MQQMHVYNNWILSLKEPNCLNAISIMVIVRDHKMKLNFIEYTELYQRNVCQRPAFPPLLNKNSPLISFKIYVLFLANYSQCLCSHNDTQKPVITHHSYCYYDIHHNKEGETACIVYVQYMLQTESNVVGFITHRHAYFGECV